MTNRAGGWWWTAAAALRVCLAFQIRCVLKSINGGHGGTRYHLQVQSGSLSKAEWACEVKLCHHDTFTVCFISAFKPQDGLWFSALAFNEPRNVSCSYISFVKQLVMHMFISARHWFITFNKPFLFIPFLCFYVGGFVNQGPKKKESPLSYYFQTVANSSF